MMRRLSSVIFLSASTLFTSLSYAVAVPTGGAPGFYVGGQFGYSELYYTNSMLNATNTTGSFTPSINNTGAGGRAYVGYQINPYFGTEVGYTYYNNAKIKSLDAGGYSNVSGTIQERATDLVLRATYPLINSGFNIYAKAGIALLSRTTSAVLCSASGVCDVTAGLFTYGGGFTYNILPKVPLDFSWTRVQQNNNISNADLAAIGIGYNFG